MVNKNLIFVILCGGYSTRAGFDKGLFLRNKKPQVKVLYEMIKLNIDCLVFVSIRKEQFEDYSKFFSKEIFIFDSTNYSGPWNGIMSVHITQPNKDLFVLGCDLLNIEWRYIQNLIQIYNYSSYDFYMYRDDKNIQTLCGIYTHQKLKELNKSKHFNMSIKEEIKISNSFVIPLSEEDKIYFKNYNYTDDFKFLCRD
ncbi:MAG: NTP transferase domain-containing protein [Leptospiraceae bacterium]|nr:NTP transferase domain-containing protein [Leptospiraceae bacterium]